MCEHIADAADQGELVTWFQNVLSLTQPTTINVNNISFYLGKFVHIYYQWSYMHQSILGKNICVDILKQNVSIYLFIYYNLILNNNYEGVYILKFCIHF